MREQDLIASLSGEAGEPLRLWLMIPGMNRSADAADAFLMWVAVGDVCFFFEAPIIRNVAGGKASQNYLLPIHRDGLPIIVEHFHAGCGDSREILLIHHPLMVAEGHEGRGD